MRANRRFYLIGDDGRLVNGKLAGRLVQVAASADPDGTSYRSALSRRLDRRTGDVELGEPVETNFYGRPVAGQRRRRRVRRGALVVRRAATPARPGGRAGRRLAIAASRGASRSSRRERSSALAREAGEDAVDGRRFRMLFGIDGVEPHEEDGWVGRRVAFGDGGRQVRRRSSAAAPSRPTNPDTGVPDLDTLRIIRRYRSRRRERGAASDRRLGRRRAAGSRPASATRWSRCDGDDRSGHVARHRRRSRSRTSTRRPRSTATRSGCARSAATATPSSSERRAATTPLVTLVGDPDAPPRPPRHDGALPPRAPRSVPRRAGPVAPPGNGRRAPVHRRLRSSRLRGALPRRSGRATGSRSTATARARSGAYADGELQMATLPLDLEGVLASARPRAMPATGWRRERGSATSTSRSPRSRAAEAFYVGGARLRRRSCAAIPGALFVSAGGYHHHVGLNTWAGRGRPGAARRARVGCARFTIVLPDERSLCGDAGSARRCRARGRSTRTARDRRHGSVREPRRAVAAR